MTHDRRSILVFGATGRQGGSVARALLKAGWPVRAFVSDPTKPASLALQQAGAQLARGSFEETATIEAALKGVRGVFSVLPGTLSAQDEVRYGTAIANLAAKSRVDYFVYSSGASVGEKMTGVPRFDAKPRIEAHIRDLALTATIVRPMIFMEMLVRPGFGLEKGRLVSLIRPDQAMQLIAAEDIGKIVAAIFANEPRFAGVAMKIAGDRITGHELAHAFTEVAGRPIAYARFSDEVLAANADLAQMASSLETGPLAEHVDLDLMRELNPDLLSFQSWLAGRGRAALDAALQNTGTATATSGGSTGAGQ